MAFSPQDLITALVSTTQAAVPSITVWSDVPHKDVKMPFALVSLVSDVPAVYFGTNNDDFKIYAQIDVYALREYGMTALRQLAESIKAVLHKQNITVTNAANVSVFCTRRGPARPETDNVNRVIMEFMLMGSETYSS